MGGVSDSSYGASAYQQNYVGVTARKAWFFFDNEWYAWVLALPAHKRKISLPASTSAC